MTDTAYASQVITREVAFLSQIKAFESLRDDCQIVTPENRYNVDVEKLVQRYREIFKNGSPDLYQLLLHPFNYNVVNFGTKYDATHEKFVSIHGNKVDYYYWKTLQILLFRFLAYEVGLDYLELTEKSATNGDPYTYLENVQRLYSPKPFAKVPAKVSSKYSKDDILAMKIVISILSFFACINVAFFLVFVLRHVRH